MNPSDYIKTQIPSGRLSCSGQTKVPWQKCLVGVSLHLEDALSFYVVLSSGRPRRAGLASLRRHSTKERAAKLETVKVTSGKLISAAEPRGRKLPGTTNTSRSILVLLTACASPGKFRRSGRHQSRYPLCIAPVFFPCPPLPLLLPSSSPAPTPVMGWSRSLALH